MIGADTTAFNRVLLSNGKGVADGVPLLTLFKPVLIYIYPFLYSLQLL